MRFGLTRSPLVFTDEQSNARAPIGTTRSVPPLPFSPQTKHINGFHCSTCAKRRFGASAILNYMALHMATASKNSFATFGTGTIYNVGNACFFSLPLPVCRAEWLGQRCQNVFGRAGRLAAIHTRQLLWIEISTAFHHRECPFHHERRKAGKVSQRRFHRVGIGLFMVRQCDNQVSIPG